MSRPTPTLAKGSSLPADNLGTFRFANVADDHSLTMLIFIVE